jgi:hypothetical protein
VTIKFGIFWDVTWCILVELLYLNVEAADSSVTSINPWPHNITPRKRVILYWRILLEVNLKHLHVPLKLISISLWTRNSQLMKFYLRKSTLWMVIYYGDCLPFHESDWQSQSTHSEGRLSLWEWRKRFRIVGGTLHFLMLQISKQTKCLKLQLYWFRIWTAKCTHDIINCLTEFWF